MHFREAREAKGMSQKFVALTLGVSSHKCGQPQGNAPLHICASPLSRTNLGANERQSYAI